VVQDKLMLAALGTVTDFFNIDETHSMRVTSSNSLRTADGVDVQFKLFQDFSAGSIYPAISVPESGSRSDVLIRLIQPDNLKTVLDAAPGMTVISESNWGPAVKSAALKFCGHVYFYTSLDMAEEDHARLQSAATQLGLTVECFGPSWAKERSARQKPEAFLSHDSRDKDAVARPLAWELSKLGVPVWYDDFSLRVGDSLREKIETGLKECKRCILVLSPNFISNSGWTKREFDSVFTRELLDQKQIVLPVWVGVTKRQVYEYSPSLADRVAVTWDRGVKYVAGQLAQVVKHAG
jgi:TIR domain-containing protein